MDMQVSIIIPVYNLYEYTRDCLRSILANVDGEGFEVIVVDNGSTDDTPVQCPTEGGRLFGDRFAYVRNHDNLGFAVACNRGAEKATGRFLFFLNNDTEILEDCLPGCMAVAESSDRVGAVVPHLEFPEVGRTQHAGVVFCPNVETHHIHAYFPVGNRAARRARTCQAVTGAALFIAKPLFEAVGRFDEAFSNGYEDVDLCARLLRNRYECRAIPAGRVLHYTSQTPGRFDNEQANFIRLLQRTHDIFYPDINDQLAADGYALGLNAWLRPVPVVPAEARADLLARLAGATETICRDILVEEPCLAEGYEVLAARWQAAGNHDEVSRLRYWQTCIMQTLPNYMSLLEALRVADPDGRLPYVLETIQTIEKGLSDRDELRNKARFFAGFAARHGNETLAACYRGWLESR